MNSASSQGSADSDSASPDRISPDSASPQRVGVGVDGRVGYHEKLRAPFSWWVIAFMFGLSLGLIPLPVAGPWWALSGLVGGTVLSSWAVAAYGRVEIDVSGTVLRAGRATLPASALGDAVALDAERARALRTYEADPRAFLLLRSYVSTAVRVEVADPADPTPYLYLSSRRPKQLAAAVNALSR